MTKAARHGFSGKQNSGENQESEDAVSKVSARCIKAGTTAWLKWKIWFSKSLGIQNQPAETATKNASEIRSQYRLIGKGRLNDLLLSFEQRRKKPIITKQMLMDANACSKEIDLFKSAFGNGTIVTVERAIEATN